VLFNLDAEESDAESFFVLLLGPKSEVAADQTKVRFELLYCTEVYIGVWVYGEEVVEIVEHVLPAPLSSAVLRAKGNERRSSIVYRYKRRKTLDLYTEKRLYSASPSITTAARSLVPVPELGLLIGMGAGEAHGGYEPPNAIEATGPNPMPTDGSILGPVQRGGRWLVRFGGQMGGINRTTMLPSSRTPAAARCRSVRVCGERGLQDLN
jgi:hypothetical protein